MKPLAINAGHGLMGQQEKSLVSIGKLFIHWVCERTRHSGIEPCSSWRVVVVGGCRRGRLISSPRRIDELTTAARDARVGATMVPG